MDSDLGPFDVLEGRLRRADTVLLLDCSFARCVAGIAEVAGERRLLAVGVKVLEHPLAELGVAEVLGHRYSSVT